MKQLSKLFLVASLVAMLTATTGRGQSRDSQVVMTDRAAARFLDQATWGPTPDSIAELQKMGIRNWLDWQFSLNSSDLPDQPFNFFDLGPIQRAFFQNAVTGEDQLRQRVAFALSEIWVVSGVQVLEVYPFPYYWRVLRDNAFGNYRDIIKAVTLNPAMGSYLNLANNNKGNPATGAVANENYARELMQLFTLGLTRLNLDGSPVLDQNQQPVPTYSDLVVPEMAKALTGWTYPTAPGAVAIDNNPPYYIGRMFAVERNHDTSAKTIFDNIVIPAGQTAEQDLEAVIDALMRQTTMASFISRQLILHLVTSNPSPAYIQRVSKVFLDNGRGVRGDIREVIRAILTDPEARYGDDPGALPNPNFGHLREPVLCMVNVLRGLNSTLHWNPQIDSMLLAYGSKMEQELFRAPSVFSYFSPQYRIPNGLFGPEFQIYSTHTAIQRLNFINAVVNVPSDATTTIDLLPFLPGANDLDRLLDSISSVFLHHSMSPDLRRAATSAASTVGGMERVRAALYVVLTTGEYQIIQ